MLHFLILISKPQAGSLHSTASDGSSTNPMKIQSRLESSTVGGRLLMSDDVGAQRVTRSSVNTKASAQQIRSIPTLPRSSSSILNQSSSPSSGTTLKTYIESQTGHLCLTWTFAPSQDWPKTALREQSLDSISDRYSICFLTSLDVRSSSMLPMRPQPFSYLQLEHIQLRYNRIVSSSSYRIFARSR